MSSAHTLWNQRKRVALTSKFLLLAVVALPLMAQALEPAKDASIVSYCIDDGAKGPGFETGPIRITYSDGTVIIQSLPPLKNVNACGNYDEVGIIHPKLAGDKVTLGWVVSTWSCCQSYPIPVSLMVFRSGKIIGQIRPIMPIWHWRFADRGKKVAVYCRPTHGSSDNSYYLYEAKTGRLISEASDDCYDYYDGCGLPAKAPKWAKQLEHQVKQYEREWTNETEKIARDALTCP